MLCSQSSSTSAPSARMPWVLVDGARADDATAGQSKLNLVEAPEQSAEQIVEARMLLTASLSALVVVSVRESMRMQSPSV